MILKPTTVAISRDATNVIELGLVEAPSSPSPPKAMSWRA